MTERKGKKKKTLRKEARLQVRVPPWVVRVWRDAPRPTRDLIRFHIGDAAREAASRPLAVTAEAAQVLRETHTDVRPGAWPYLDFRLPRTVYDLIRQAEASSGVRPWMIVAVAVARMASAAAPRPETGGPEGRRRVLRPAWPPPEEGP